jgi:hypothetical protein
VVRIEYLLSFWEFPSELTDYGAKNHQSDQLWCKSPCHVSSALVFLRSWINALPWTSRPHGCWVRLRAASLPSVQVGTLLVPRRPSSFEARSKLSPQCALLPGALEAEQHFPGCPPVYSAFSSSSTVTAAFPTSPFYHILLDVAV